MVNADVRDFYDGLAPQYALIFDDWWAAAASQGRILRSLFESLGIVPAAAVLDCTCGIGTQAVPLALEGFAVTASDLSAAAVERAQGHAQAHGVALDLRVADMRQLPADLLGRFEAVISCDNSLPHLLTDEDLADALASVRRCLRPGGLFLASLRDYDVLSEAPTPGVAPMIMGTLGSRHAVAQAWTWSDSRDAVKVVLFVLVERAPGWEVTSFETTYRAIRRSALSAAIRQSGFTDVRWHEPASTGYYQPIVTAQAPA